MATRMPKITMTISRSISVKPCLLLISGPEACVAIIYEQNIHRKNLALKFNQEKDQYAKDLQAVASIEVHGDAKDYS